MLAHGGAADYVYYQLKFWNYERKRIGNRECERQLHLY